MFSIVMLMCTIFFKRYIFIHGYFPHVFQVRLLKARWFVSFKNIPPTRVLPTQQSPEVKNLA